MHAKQVDLFSSTTALDVAAPKLSHMCEACPCADAHDFSASYDKNLLFGNFFAPKK
jgi:hypothetical protein